MSGPAWTGHLVGNAFAVTGELQDQHGWLLRLAGGVVPTGPSEPPRKRLYVTVAAVGEPVDALRLILTECGVLTGTLEQVGDTEWVGRLVAVDDVTAISVTAAVQPDGRFELQGVG